MCLGSFTRDSLGGFGVVVSDERGGKVPGERLHNFDLGSKSSDGGGESIGRRVSAVGFCGCGHRHHYEQAGRKVLEIWGLGE
ncbi:unnamed protein product [Linum trigynum]|uniref:Uncharacterized protein n=1 Tax=Linum trigynum TaxID=586398 RepID=A0AAV2FQM3_9ROSI